MTIPPKPPVFGPASRSRLAEALEKLGGWDSLESLLPEEYLHWDQLRHRTPPEGISVEEWWHLLKLTRSGMLKECTLRDKEDRPFRFGLPDAAMEILHRIDQGAGGVLDAPPEVKDPAIRDRYIVSSLIEESIRSSQVEGASTTREIAKEMIRSGREPRTKGEQMVLNNFRAMDHVRGIKDQRLTPESLFVLHRILTENTLREAEQSGRLRLPTEPIRVEDHYGNVLHVPPPAGQLEGRLREMCDFANGLTPKGFLHPAIRAILLHFWLAYDHPFVDGNGRCARALFYWCMLRNGYWLCEFISISEIVHRAPARYQRAFLHTETDDNDLTYFILYHLDTIRQAIEGLHRYIRRKASEISQLEATVRVSLSLNHRQRALLSHALRHPDQRYSVESHRLSHGVVYQTARTDLLSLARKGFLKMSKIGRTMYFRPADNLRERLSSRKG